MYGARHSDDRQPSDRIVVVYRGRLRPARALLSRCRVQDPSAFAALVAMSSGQAGGRNQP